MLRAGFRLSVQLSRTQVVMRDIILESLPDVPPRGHINGFAREAPVGALFGRPLSAEPLNAWEHDGKEGGKRNKKEQGDSLQRLSKEIKNQMESISDDIP